MRNLVHRDDVRRLGIGAVAVVVGCAIAYVGTVVQAGGELPFRSYTTVKADFDDVGTLKPQQKVTENGVRVGIVTNVEYKSGGGARVTMRLDGNHPMYRDASAKVGNESALGRKLVDIDRGTSGAGPLGDQPIAASVTRQTGDLNTVLESFPEPARQGLGTMLKNLGGGMTGHGPELNVTLERSPEILADAQTLLDAVNSQDANLSGMLATANDLASDLAVRQAELGELVDDTATTFEAINVSNTDPLRETLDELPSTLRTARKSLDDLNPALEDTAHAATKLRPGVVSLVDATPDLRGFLTESPPVARVVVKFAKDSAGPVESLVPAVHEARPLVVKRLAKTFDYGGPLLSDLYEYIPNIGGLASEYRLLSGKYSWDKHYFSAQLAFPGLYNVSLPGVGDPTVDYRPYPGGNMAAWKDTPGATNE